MLKWETFPLYVSEDKFVLNNYTAGVMEATADKCWG